MRNQNDKLLIFVFCSIVLIIFFPLFIQKEIIGGDWPFFYQEMFSDFHILTPLWISQQGIGLGGVNPLFPFLNYLYVIVSFFVKTLNFSWEVIYRVFFFFPPLFMAFLSVKSLIKILFKKNQELFLGVAFVIYCTNTYFLLLASGGQVGIMLAYSLSPMVLANFIKIFNSFYKDDLAVKTTNYKQLLFTGIILSAQFAVDLRLAYITLFASFLYFIFLLISKETKFKAKASVILISSLTPFSILFLLNFYWIVPFIVFNLLSVPLGITSSEGFKFFSFARFSDSFSLLHPNWPENIFGKTYFMRPQFLILPLIAFSSLLFISFKFKQNSSRLKVAESRYALFFILIALLGAFLAKGVNPPFGYINESVFNNIPGMNLFRDQTKFYLLISLSYSVLIPYSLFALVVWLNSKFKIQNSKLQLKVQNFLIAGFIGYWLFLIKPVWMGELAGTFQVRKVPAEYIELKDFIYQQRQFFRTLWIPFQSRFRFQTEIHPLVNANILFQTDDYDEMIKILEKPETYSLLQDLSIKYVIIPYDSTAEIFLEDRKYDPLKRKNLEEKIDDLGILKKIQEGNISIYEVSDYKEHFFLEKNSSVSYKRINSSDYLLNVESADSKELIFSEAYHYQWKAFVNDQLISSQETEEGLNSFLLPKGNYKVEVYFLPDRYMIYFYAVSIVSFLAIFIYLIKSKDKL